MTPSFAFPCFLLIVALFQFTAFSSSSEQPAVVCHRDERLALKQFKESFIIDKHACAGSYPKVDSWGSEGVDCCSWDGVECDQMTGVVIGLDLSGACLYGSINSSSTLFRLLHLQKLNLAHNHFNHSAIPSALGNLSMLTYLNLSSSVLSGQIPSEISKLYRLSSLDLSSVDVSSPVPSVLANFSSLKTLYLDGCGLQGMFPLATFQLPRLETISLSDNSNLTGYLPEFNSSNQLKFLAIWHTGFSGELPASIGNLNSMEYLELGSCSFRGLVPSTLGNLPNLKFLDLSINFFRGSVPATLGNLTRLNYLDLQGNQYFTGFIPPELANLTKLTHLDLQQNKLQGSVPSSIRGLQKLEYFNCDYNRLGDILDVDTFLELKNLQNLFLSWNHFYLVSRNNSNSTGAQLVDIGLRDCHLREFPYFLRNQRRLQLLDLSSNNIEDQIPHWMSKVSVETLSFLDLSNNSLTGFDDFPVVLPWSKLQFLKLDSNSLQGSLPVPPLSTVFYTISNNSLSGEIPHQLRSASSLFVLDISQNNFSGNIPLCLSNSSKYLSVLKLRSNNLQGPIPSGWSSGNRLRMIDLGRNKLQGRIPKSLMECRMLEHLDLGNNRIRDAFPSWLGSLPELNILILSSNAFYGTIGDPTSSNLAVFPKLRVIDLSHNRFNGTLPSGYFEKWISMASLDGKNSQAAYMDEISDMLINALQVSRSYSYSMTITNKGTEMQYPKIIRTLAAIDFSCNSFEGEIPESIGNLKELQLLNFSNNNLVGGIPKAIANLNNLETLGLSRNELEGRIPLELSSQLNFLEVLNLSYNHLTGLIPQGQQFETFESSSFEGNPGLCGKPLLRECITNSGSLPTPSSEESGSLGGLDWKVILLGYGCGFLFGTLIGHVVIKKKPACFLNTVSKTPATRQRS
ncbi:receptor like protein 6 [Hibiscus trionum]|uniref:Receptor like protein 6 n=1 Tax=Hibiscus trionum TaxID=183268 RepID=A0A9W7GT83_HIBTR|nr:receptor like protein 6 [Hibiscus trionum]